MSTYQSTGNTILCKELPPKKTDGAIILIEQKWEYTNLLEVVTLGLNFENINNIKIGDKVYISEYDCKIKLDGIVYYTINADCILGSE